MCTPTVLVGYQTSIEINYRQSISNINYSFCVLFLIYIPCDDRGGVNFSIAGMLSWYKRLGFPVSNQLILLLYGVGGGGSGGIWG